MLSILFFNFSIFLTTIDDHKTRIKPINKKVPKTMGKIALNIAALILLTYVSSERAIFLLCSLFKT